MGPRARTARRRLAVAAALVLLVAAEWPSAANQPSARPERGQPAAGGCKYEENCECAVPGITIRWKAVYCMYLNETDDLENEAVSACLHGADPEPVERGAACEQNAYWKERICRARHEHEDEAARACAADPKMIPPFVEFGPGARPQDRREREGS